MTTQPHDDRLPPLTAAMAEKLALSPSAASRRWWAQLQAALALEPEPYREKLARDLQSKKVDEFYAAAFELYLTQLFIDKGWTFRREQPLPGRVKRPDYFIEHPEGPFYLEATVAMDSTAQLTQNHLLNDLRETLRPVRGPFHAMAVLLTPIPGDYSRKHVRQWLSRTVDELNAQGVTGEVERTYEAPAGKGEFRIRFHFLPGDDDEDGVVGGWWPNGDQAMDVTTGDTIRAKIDSKLRQYDRAPELPDPYVVALHINTGMHATGFQVTKALYGEPTVRYVPGPGPKQGYTYTTHAPTGLLTALRRDGTPIRRRISAIVLYQHTFPNEETELHEAVVCHHPAALHPLSPTAFADWPQVQLVAIGPSLQTPRWTKEPPDWAVRSWV